MKLHQILSALFFGVVTSVSLAQETISIVHTLPPGGLHERTNNAVQAGLESAGIKVEKVRFDNCKALENYVKNNPTKPVVFDYLLTNQALHQIDPTHPSGCNLPMDAKSVLVITFKTQFQACSLGSAGNARDLWLSGKGKLGVTANPALNGPMAQRIVNDINPNIKVITYKANPALLQAMVSREIDFVGVFSNASSVIAAGGQCFFTTANQEKADKFQQISIDAVKKNSTMSDIGYLSVIIGYNVDVNRIRPIIVETIKTNKDLSTVFANGGDQIGIVKGQTPEQQFREVESWLSRFRK
jgi:hypothetical protein